MPNVHDDDEESLLFADESEWIEDEEAEPEATAGPGQVEDNYVHSLECGHEHDDAEQLPAGHIVNCSVHGLTRVTSN